MPKLFVISGHGAGDPGACGNGYSEAERVRALASRIKELGGDDVMLADFDRNYYADNGISYMSLPDDCSIVELHMDSGGAGARGGHVITSIRGANKYDYALARLMERIFPGRANLIVQRSDLANPNRAAYRGFDYRLIENGFISNAGDVDTFNSQLDEIAYGYLAAFGIEVNKMAMAPVTVPKVGAPVYRVYNTDTGEHFYTVNDGERAALLGDGWTDEGVAWNCPQPEIAVYRMYNPHKKHHFAPDFNEAESLQKTGWTFEGVQFFGAASGQPIYRVYNHDSGDHLLTANESEYRAMVNAGWMDEGIVFYA